MNSPYLFAVALLIATGSGCSSPDSPTPVPPPPIGRNAVFVGAGDIGECGVPGPEETARLLDGISGTVFTTGDNAYYSGSAEDFRRCYDPSWGRHKARTYPTPGNHDYLSPGAAPYFAYFGSNAGPPGLGYYSLTLETWHVVALNNYVPINAASEQLAWLDEDLRGNPTPCTVVYWHEPLFSSGPSGGARMLLDAWRLLYIAGVDVVLNGHDHLYERFAPQDPNGRADQARGIREFIVGTGGGALYGFSRLAANSEARASVHGVLKLTLKPGGYEWEFLPVVGGAPLDSGSGVCH